LLALLVFIQIPPSAVEAYNYIVVLKDGREIGVDLYGESGDALLLHRNGRAKKISRALVREVRRVKPSDLKPPDRIVQREIPGGTLVMLEDEASTLGWASVEEERAWLADVLLQARGDPCDPRATATGKAIRWTRSPSVSRFGGGESAEQALEAAVSDLNEALARTGLGLQRGPPEDHRADIQVFFMPRAAFPAGLPLDRSHLDGCARILRTGPKAAVIRAAQIWVAENPRLDEAFAGLDAEANLRAKAVLLQEHLQAVVLHELVHALGLSHSAVFRDSIMYCRQEKKRRGVSRWTRLSQRDREALAFFYTHVRPGDRAPDLKRAAEIYWYDF